MQATIIQASNSDRHYGGKSNDRNWPTSLTTYQEKHPRRILWTKTNETNDQSASVQLEGTCLVSGTVKIWNGGRKCASGRSTWS